MSTKKDPKDVPTDEHLEATQEQVESHRDEGGPETGPDPIIEATDQAIADAEQRAEEDQDDDAPKLEDVTTVRSEVPDRDGEEVEGVEVTDA